MNTPPALDGRLMAYTTGQLKWAGLLFLLNAFWMCGSPTIFGKHSIADHVQSWSYIKLKSHVMESQHYIRLESHSGPILFLIACTIVIINLHVFFSELVHKLGYGVS